MYVHCTITYIYVQLLIFMYNYVYLCTITYIYVQLRIFMYNYVEYILPLVGRSVLRQSSAFRFKALGELSFCQICIDND